MTDPPVHGPPFAGYQSEIFLLGMGGKTPDHPVSIVELERSLPTRVRYSLEWEAAGEVVLRSRGPSIATQRFRIGLMSDVQEDITGEVAAAR